MNSKSSISGKNLTSKVAVTGKISFIETLPSLFKVLLVLIEHIANTPIVLVNANLKFYKYFY